MHFDIDMEPKNNIFVEPKSCTAFISLSEG